MSDTQPNKRSGHNKHDGVARRGGMGGRSGAPKPSGDRRAGGQAARSSENKPVFTLSKPVFFIGFMGAGKTSVSRRLARMCHIVSIDMDAYLERREDKKVKEIFAELGEEGFRCVETSVLRELAAKEPVLISCGGGVVKRPENRVVLSDAGFVVYLKVSADEAAGRISDLSTRPLFRDLDAARQMNEDRLPLYDEVADATIDTAGKSVGRIAAEVRELLKKEGILWQQQG